ncbi:hypothetical protein GCM10009846_02740 [Agrococcus versicolor]|uniref:Gram-positive cocci surface proteins LPxTG domain-containing protein n=1 Tax=Agrococcus versicolor TaxID=501482 RepID=A0ABN3AJB2_9MICO
MRRTLHRTAAAVLTAVVAIGGALALGVAPASAATFGYSGSLSDGVTTLGPGCATFPESSAFSDVQQFAVTAAGEYDLSITQASRIGLELHLFQGAFDPQSASGCIAAASSSQTALASIDATLAADTQYFLVTSGQSSQGQASFTNAISGPGDIVPVAPTVAVTLAEGQPFNAARLPIRLAVTFSEPVTGFGLDDVRVLGGATRPDPAYVEAGMRLTGSGAAYELTILDLPSAYLGNHSVTVVAGAAVTARGAANLASPETITFGFSPTSPTAQVRAITAPVVELPATFEIVWSTWVQGFDLSDVQVSGTAGPSDVTLSGEGDTFLVTVRAAEQPGTITVGAANDGATSAGLTSLFVIPATLEYQPTAPGVTMTPSAEQPDPAAVVFDVVFSQSVTGVEANDFSVSGTAGATTVAVTGSGTTYVATVTGATQVGTVVLAIAEGAGTTTSGFGSLAATSTVGAVTAVPVVEPTPGTPAPSAPAPSASAPGASAPAVAGGQAAAGAASLPRTGFESTWMLLAAAMLLLGAGVGARRLARR